MPHAGVVAVIIGITVATVLYFIFGNDQQQDQHRYHSSRTCTEEIDDTDVCPICLSSLNHRIHKLKSCTHRFHRSCIEEWRNEALGPLALCPVCRSPFTL